jgi:transcriptional regulator with XRE-family HTH domain
LTAAQCRAARSLLGWSQQDLASKANVGTSTVADFEREKRSPVANNLEAMRAALESAGISFPPGGAVIGPWLPRPTRSTVPNDRLTPMRWISETDLGHWADTRAGQDTMPDLIRRLVLAEQGYLQMRFPSGDSVSMHGWDGECSSEIESAHVPSGLSGWEIGVDQRPGTKAKSDYGARVKDPQHLDPKKTTFVFVTPRRWAQKGKWLAERRAESRWGGVRALDAVDLVEWLERYPGVALWLSTHLGKTPAGIRELKEFWREWSIATRRPLSIELVLADRDAEATRVLRWLYDSPAAISVQAESTDEATSFLYASVAQLPPQYAEFYLTRSVVVANAKMARALANIGTSLVIVLQEPDVGLARVLVEKGHHVFLPFGSGMGAPTDTLKLKRPSRYAIEHELKELGFKEDEARKLARDSGRSLTIIRRLLPSAPGVVSPEWASTSTARTLLPVLLAGGWDEGHAADKEAIAGLAEQPYDIFVEQLINLLSVPDSPIRKVGTTWRLASPRDAWFRLAHLISDKDMENFCSTALSVLSAADPRFELVPEDRWLASMKGKSPRFSSFIQQGLTETLILFNVFGDRATSIIHPAWKASKIVKDLLDDADGARWWSLAEHLEELAEASPEAFLDAVERGLQKPDAPIMALFTEEPGFFGSSNHSHLLWALETLAWSPDYLARVSELLARLAQKDPGGRLSNRPDHSLVQIHLLWYPQTYATSQERLQVINRLRRIENVAAWNLMLALYPSSHGITHNSPTPRWRDFAVSEREPLTRPLIATNADQLGEWLLEDVGDSVRRWTELTNRFSDLSAHLQQGFLKNLSTVASCILDDASRLELQSALRRFIHKHREFAHAQWALPESELSGLEAIYHALTPSDPVHKVAWLFESYNVPLLHPIAARDFHANEEAVNEERRRAMRELTASSGESGILALVEAAKAPVLVGKAVAETATSALVDAMMLRGLNQGAESGRNFAFGIIGAFNQEKGTEWGLSLLERARTEHWSDDMIVNVLMSLPRSEAVLRASSSFGETVERRYWHEAGMHWISAGDESVPWVAEKLISFGRARDAIHLIGGHLKHVPSATMLNALRAALQERKSREAEQDNNNAVMFQHYVQEIFQKLDQSKDVSEEDVALLEWSYLLVLEHSSRPPKALHQRLAAHPEFFVELLSLLYRSTNKNENADLAEGTDQEKRSTLATHAYRLLNSWHGMAGLKDSRVDEAALNKWIAEARALCEKAGRKEIGDQKIGETFAWASPDPDGTWPCAAVRNVIEAARNDDIETGVYIGVRNSRGITSRSPLDGGNLERAEAAKYRNFAKAIRTEFPRTYAVLERIAKSYDHDAQHHDEDVERRQL